MQSPTSSWDIRNDSMGSGYFGAPRGSRTHNGIDLVVEPQQGIVSPIFGNVIREAFPYASDLKWAGCLIRGTQKHEGLEIKMFYMRLFHHIRKTLKTGHTHYVFPGVPIGTAQDISKKHGEAMTPHVHFEIRKRDWQIINPQEAIDGNI